MKLLVKEADLPPIRLHDLRHGAASLALVAGVDVEVVSEMLGYSTTAITPNTYTAVFCRAQARRRGGASTRPAVTPLPRVDCELRNP
ncbi:tyrosine-type recombinase/integrase [Catenulispora rubra]|uniref:tyrosine-type recombinase/integrase n=1 Tax=Catenulispora rubra TaxID=280293 RepID=UPI001892836B